MKTINIPKNITHTYEFSAFARQIDAKIGSPVVEGTIIAKLVERDNLYHILVQNDNVVSHCQGYVGFLFAPNPDGKAATIGDHVKLVLDKDLGGYIREGWSELNVTRAFAEVAKVWIARDIAVEEGLCFNNEQVEGARVCNFFSILSEDEPVFFDDEEAA